MSAVENGDNETVILLLDNGANIQSKTKLTTPIYIAQEKGHLEIQNLLKDRGAPQDPGFFWRLRRSILIRFENLLCK